MDDTRPDPDALMAEAAREGRGRPKVFLGAAPGVGKTWEMLAQARRRLAEGVHVLARHPGLLLIDELAHTNAPGSRHAKRWEDVEELLAAGLDVWTTLNVQHLESLNDDVARITGVRVTETLPDRVLEGADENELIDVPPAELRTRLNDGRIYGTETARRALDGYFEEGKLAVLREIAQRRTAAHVDDDVRGWIRSTGVSGPWPVRECVLALIGPDAGREGPHREPPPHRRLQP